MTPEPRGRALVIHPGALGDVLQAVPALRVLAADANVSFCGQPRLGELLVGGGVVTEGLAFDGFGLDTLFTAEPLPARLAQRLAPFDEVISWFGSRDERYPARLREATRRCTVAPPVPDGDGETPVWRYLLESLGPRRAAAECAPMSIPAEWRTRAHRVLEESGVGAGVPVVVVHAGAGGQWKVVPPAILAAALAHVRRTSAIQVLLHEGPADHEAADALADFFDARPARLVDPPLALLAGVLSLAGAYLGGDSGISHLAAAVGARAIILFPPATLQRWRPWSESATAIATGENDRMVAEEAARALRDAVSG